MFCSSMRSAYFAAVAARPRPLEREARAACLRRIGVHRIWTLRKKTIPFGPQYSTVFGKTSPSMKTLFVWPMRNRPSAPQA